MSKLSTSRNPEYSKSQRFLGSLCTLAVLLCAAQGQEEPWEELNALAHNLRRQKRYAEALSEGQRGLRLAELTGIGQVSWWAHQYDYQKQPCSKALLDFSLACSTLD